MPETPIVLLGAGGHCRSCIDVIEWTGQYTIGGVVERADSHARGPVLGYPVIGSDDELPAIRRTYQYAMVTVGQIKSATERVSLYRRLRELDFTLSRIISPLAYVSPHAEIGEGTIVMHHAVINAGAIVGHACIVNTKALIEHDARVGDHCHISTAAVVNGGAAVGARSFIGSNATVAHNVRLTDDWFCGAGRMVGSATDGAPMDRG